VRRLLYRLRFGFWLALHRWADVVSAHAFDRALRVESAEERRRWERAN
jgi:hypothetical protein